MTFRKNFREQKCEGLRSIKGLCQRLLGSFHGHCGCAKDAFGRAV